MSGMVAVVTWPDVALALIAGMPGIIAAVAALRVHAKIKTPSGTPIGQQVEDVQHVALANHYQLRKQNGDAMREPPLRTADVMPRIRE